MNDVGLEKYATDHGNLTREIVRLGTSASRLHAMMDEPRFVTMLAAFRTKIATANSALEDTIGNVKRWAAEVPAGPLEDLQKTSEPNDPRAADLARAFR